jgi:hypothetical protein
MRHRTNAHCTACNLHETPRAPELINNFKPGASELHGLTYEPLLRQLIQLNINYVLLRINSTTDHMALAAG